MVFDILLIFAVLLAIAIIGYGMICAVNTMIEMVGSFDIYANGDEEDEDDC